MNYARSLLYGVLASSACWCKTALPLVNGGFESGVAGWRSDSVGMTLFLAEAAYGGKRGIRVCDESFHAGSELVSDALPARGGRAYEVSFMGRTSGSSEGIGFYLLCYDAAGACLASPEVGEQVSYFRMTGAWKRYRHVVLAPAGTVRIAIRVHSLKNQRSQADVDEFEVYEYSEAESASVRAAESRLSPQEKQKRRLESKMLRVAFDDVVDLLRVVEVSVHPRLFASAPEFEALKHAVEAGDGIHALMFGRLSYVADALLTVPVVERKLEGIRLLEVSERAQYRIAVLALCYRLSGKEAYRDRCIAEMRAIAAFSDWNPSHYLDTAEMTLALATGYDWLYDELSEADRQLMGTAILEKGLKNDPERKAGWRTSGSNWGQVCHAGMLAGALAVCELDPQLCRRQIYESISALAIPMRVYAPHGNYPEGPNYWTYGTGFNVLALSMLFQALGTDFGLSELPGFKETAYFNEYMTGPSGQCFNFADCPRLDRSSCGITWWFARHFDMPELVELGERAWFESLCKDRRPLDAATYSGWFSTYSFFWLEDHYDCDEAPRLPLIWNGEGTVPICVMRSSWEADGSYVGLKGGSPGSNHGHMDCGSFVWDAGGVRWLEDLGPEDYHRIESMGIQLWDSKQDGDRWKLFRLNNWGHNTLVLDGKLQRVDGKVAIDCRKEDGHKIAVMDLTSAYADACTSAVRRIAMDQEGKVDVTDELEGLRPGSEVLWGAGTFQAVKEGAGSRRLVLEGKGQRVLLENLGPEAPWQVVDARIPQPVFKGNSENPGLKRLELRWTAPQDGKLRLRVRMGVLK